MMAGGGGKSRDFYSVMGLHPDCNAAELRNAYKRLAMRWHPDKWSASGNPKVTEESKKKFQAIQEAYSVLSDHNKRFLYDAGLYESEDDDDMGEFLGEMMMMMNETKTQMSGSESLEDLQDLFVEMFEGDLHVCNGIQRPISPRISSSNKRNCSDFPRDTIRVEEIGEGSFTRSSAFDIPSFCIGVSCVPRFMFYKHLGIVDDFVVSVGLWMIFVVLMLSSWNAECRLRRDQHKSMVKEGEETTENIRGVTKRCPPICFSIKADDGTELVCRWLEQTECTHQPGCMS